MAADAILRRIHRAIALVFLVTIPSAAYASFAGKATSPLVYLPLFPLFGLILTGSYLLVKPWILGWRPHQPPAVAARE